jgi:hypothetical protein
LKEAGATGENIEILGSCVDRKRRIYM